MSSFRALLDANVLYPNLLRDLLIRLAIGGVYRPLWSDEILEEVKRALERNRPDVDRERIVQLMRKALPDAIVSDYAAYAVDLILPDAGDQHVVAAAVVGQAAVIVTYNLAHFQVPEIRDVLHLDVQHPDTFLEHACSLDPVPFCACVRKQREALKAPPLSVDELLDAYRRMGLTTTAAVLAGHHAAL